MNKMVLMSLTFFISGVLIGRLITSSQMNGDFKMTSKKWNKEKYLTKKVPCEESLRKKRPVEKDDALPEKKNKEYIFFNKKRNKQGKVESLLNKINLKDHHVENGEANMEIIDLYEEALGIDSENVKTLDRYSNYMLMLQRYDEAKSLIEKCLSVDPRNHGCLGNSTIYALHGGTRDEIDKKINDCLKVSPSNVQCLHNKGNSFLAKGDGEKALEYFKKLEKFNGSHNIRFSKAILYLGYAQAYEKMKDKKNAKKYYENSCSEGEEYACEKAKEK